MTKLTELAEIDTLEDSDILYVYDVSQPGSRDKEIAGAKLRPSGARITNYLRFGGNVTLPNITADTEMNMAISVPGVLVGDHVVFNPDDTLPSGLGITPGCQARTQSPFGSGISDLRILRWPRPPRGCSSRDPSPDVPRSRRKRRERDCLGTPANDPSG